MLKDLTIESKSEIDSFLKYRFQLSDLNFTNLFIWSKSENIKYYIEDETLFIKGNYMGEDYYFSPIRKDLDFEKLRIAFRKIASIKTKIVFIPCEYGDILKDEFNLIKVRDTFDYIYNQSDLGELKGRKFSQKKNKINQFMKKFNFTYEKISEKNINEIIEFQNQWLIEKINSEPESKEILEEENLGIKEILKNYFILNLRGGLIRVDNKLIGYAIGEKITEDMGVIHIEKGDVNYSGIYQMINKFVAKEEFSDIKYLNREDDFGVEGLRKAKMSYHPIKLLEKYTMM